MNGPDASRQPRTGNICSIPPGCNFLGVLVESLMDGRLVPGFSPVDDPLLLSSATIFLPNRRAARALVTTFLGSGIADATILPAIRMLGDVDDEEFGLGVTLEDLPDRKEVIHPLERQLELAGLIEQWVSLMSGQIRKFYEDENINIPASKADAIRLADDLGRLLNQLTLEEISWSAISDIIPADKDWAEWWRLTATFLKIIMENWPEHLEARGLLDPSKKQADLLDRRTEFYEARSAGGPVIIAGSTGSVPATQRLLKAVAGMKNGAIVLPGLDTHMDNRQWQMLSEENALADPALETHPQFGLARLVTSLGVDRNVIRQLAAGGDEVEERARVISLAMAPAGFTAKWISQVNDFTSSNLTTALSGLSIVEAPGESEEALAIAIAMREVLETPQATAALITPDRNLARRVSAELERFDIEVDDSGGTPLKRTPAAGFLRVLMDVVFDGGGSVAVASLIKNPLCRAGLSVAEAIKHACNFELVALRGVIRTPDAGGFEGFLAARGKSIATDQHVTMAVRRIGKTDWDGLITYGARLDKILEPLTALASSGKVQPLQLLFGAVANAAEQLATDEAANPVLLDGLGGRELARLFEDIALTGSNGYQVDPAEFPGVFDALLGEQLVRPQVAANPRLHILGPLEVRLLEYDRVILGGLNEGTWPQTTRSDAFLNRAMRGELGMTSPERRTGLSAHDFQQLMGKRQIILSRSQRADKAPTIASRWLQRITALVGETHTAEMTSRGDKLLHLAAGIDRAAVSTNRAERPCPVPPLKVRPPGLPVTDIELWIRDPYALYAKRILKLQPLRPLERQADPALKGTLYHAILAEYVSEPGRSLRTIARRRIDAENLPPELAEIWFLRFEEIAQDFLKWEAQRANDLSITETFCEVPGELKLADGSFTLRARADRIDVLEDGSLIVLDYKTGSSPSISQARVFSPPLAPQMSLEGAMARAGGFEGVAAGDLTRLAFYRLRRGKDGGQDKLAKKDLSEDMLADNALSALEALVGAFQQSDKGYISRLYPFRQGEFSGDFDHLARAREWSFADAAGDDE